MTYNVFDITCNYLHRGCYISLLVCLSVCLFASQHYWSDIREHFTTDISVDNEELINV